MAAAIAMAMAAVVDCTNRGGIEGFIVNIMI
jgi:hypothetical protein